MPKVRRMGALGTHQQRVCRYREQHFVDGAAFASSSKDSATAAIPRSTKRMIADRIISFSSDPGFKHFVTRRFHCKAPQRWNRLPTPGAEADRHRIRGGLWPVRRPFLEGGHR